MATILYLNNIVDPATFWKSQSLDEYLEAMTPKRDWYTTPVLTEVYGKGKALEKGMLPKWRYVSEEMENCTYALDSLTKAKRPGKGDK